MCKFGDIIVVNNYIGDDGKNIGRHSFVVIDDEKGKIRGLEYDLVTNVISSIKDDNHRNKKLRYKENLELKDEDVISKYKSNKDSYIKADKLFFFNKSKLDYYLFGRISDDLLDKLMDLIEELSKEDKLVNVIENIK